MKYISTRGTAPALDSEDVILAGLARDGGLYVPDAWPQLSADEIAGLAGLDYAGLAERIIRPFLAGSRAGDRLGALVAEAYAGFDHTAVAPLKQLDHNLWLLELFHGPTLAFKDFALQLLGRLFDALLTARDERITILGATSGDTGSAAIEACRGRDRIDIFILHPDGLVSEVQRRQMTTVDASNVHNIAVAGTFDDCQDLVKALFNDLDFRDELRLSSVNSINWARIVAQIVYYFHAALALGAPHREIAFSVPSGNFGNVYAGYAARRMGLPVAQLIVGSNRNDILARFFASAVMEIEAVHPTLSPSMDIQISSNFERLLFELCERDGGAVTGLMQGLRDQRRLEVETAAWQRACALFDGFRLDDEGTLREIADVLAATGELVDPHTAIGIAAARAKSRQRDIPVVALATAHPAKFPDAMQRATGRKTDLPPRLADLADRPEHVTRMSNDAAALKSEIRSRLGLGGAP